MINLLKKLRAEQPELSQELENCMVESPHYFEEDVPRVALPLSSAVKFLSCVPDACLPSAIQNAVQQRKLNFIGGRLCAEFALERLGFKNCIVLRHASGFPIWPTGVIGSITHTDRIACAAVALSEHADGLGIDSENIFTDGQLRDVRRLCCTANENSTLFSSTNSNLVGTIVFSAKESFYKSIHARVQRYVDFSEVEIAKIDWNLSRLQLRSIDTGELNEALKHCHAYFSIAHSSVHTSVQMHM